MRKRLGIIFIMSLLILCFGCVGYVGPDVDYNYPYYYPDYGYHDYHYPDGYHSPRHEMPEGGYERQEEREDRERERE